MDAHPNIRAHNELCTSSDMDSISEVPSTELARSNFVLFCRNLTIAIFSVALLLVSDTDPIFDVPWIDILVTQAPR